MAATATILRKFHLKEITDTEEEIGKGAYCTVTKLNYRGLTCAGKKLHKLFIEQSNQKDKEAVLGRFCEECELLSNLRHPSIIQFLGVYEKEQGIPILVMEYMDMSLTNLLDKEGPLLSDLALPILKDIALGLAYIHGHDPPIVHRDLSANNVLLTKDLKAKISDVGVARILNISPDDTAKITKCPGTPIYMPPEALHDSPCYDIRIDCFSYGVLIIQMLSGQWPLPSAPTRINPITHALEAVNEFDRRDKYIATIQPQLPMLGLARTCLENNPIKRPLMGSVIQLLDKYYTDTRNTSIRRNDAMVASLKEQLDNAKFGLESSQTKIEQLICSQSLLETQLDMKGKECDNVRQEVLKLRDTVKTYIASIEDKESCVASLNEHLTKVNKLVLGKNQLSPFKIEWERCADLPEAVSFPHIVSFSEKIFVGGGHSDSEAARCSLYMSKNLKEWELFQSLPVTCFGLSKLITKLLIISGRHVDSGSIADTASTVRVFDYQFSTDPCDIKRVFCSATTIPSESVVVVGGINSKGEVVDSCDYLKFDKSIGDWEFLPPLPKPLYNANCFYVNNTVYVTGGYSSAEPLAVNKDVFCLDWDTKQWSKLCTAPYSYSCYALLAGTLLAINGCNNRGEEMRDVLMFSKSSKSFVKVAEFPEATLGSSSCCLATGEIVVVGGNRKDKTKLSCVYRGSIQL